MVCTERHCSKTSSALHLLLPLNVPETPTQDQLELEFSDVFGPIPPRTPTSIDAHEDSVELLYDNPEVLYHRSHSLVGPSSCVSHSLKLSKLTIQESDDSIESLDYQADEHEVHGVGMEDFEVLKVVGQGAFGKVYQVRKTGTSDIFAMKVMRKDKIVENNQVEYMRAERDILTKIDHPYIVQLKFSFQTKYRIYLVLDFINGGHLFFQLYRQGLFREDLARVYAAEIVSAVSHLHSNGIMHRDLKPENILLDDEGHVMLTDFGLAKEFDENTRSNSLCGTVEYMAPEIVLGKGHDKAADWWSVGILLYEMLTGKPPFTGGNREKIQQKIVKEKMKLPAYLTSEAHSLLKALLQKEANKRLRGDEIKRHKWFKTINWKRLEAREIQPSFRPEVQGKHCTANFEKRWTDMPLSDSPAASPKVNPFPDFTYVRPAASFLRPSN